MANTYDIGDNPRLTATFRNEADAVADPTSIVAKYRKPDGTVVTLTYGVDLALYKDSTGIYHTDITVDMAGRWYYRFVGTGNVIAAEETYFDVEKSAF
jgi:hypothetical protein